MLDNNTFSQIKPETYNSIGSLHKYWGRKPYNVVSESIKTFTKPSDIVLDPFCGSGVVLSQAIINGRNAVGVDLNPISILLSKVSCTKISQSDFKSIANSVIEKSKAELNGTYCLSYKCNCGQTTEMSAAVRSKENELRHLKLKCPTCGTIEREVTSEDKQITLSEDCIDLSDWFPDEELIPNGRINAKVGMRTTDLYTRRNLRALSVLFKHVQDVKNADIRDALIVTFSANLPNASRLTPIIKQRGRMAPGAWMTGFYIGEEFLEQNVFQYFSNRVQKTLKAQKELQEELIDNEVTFQTFNKTSENLSFIKDSSVDFIFTDPPYGDAVPYLEQSLLYNSWLQKKPNYESEIVISDSKVRGKNESDYFFRIKKCFQECHRVLKSNKQMVVTFHNMDSDVWHNFVNTIVESGFVLENVFPLYQKTSTPRQLNRANSIKCDMLLLFTKANYKNAILSKSEIEDLLRKDFKKLYKQGDQHSTDDLITKSLVTIYRNGVPKEGFNFSTFFNDNFVFKNNQWLVPTDN